MRLRLVFPAALVVSFAATAALVVHYSTADSTDGTAEARPADPSKAPASGVLIQGVPHIVKKPDFAGEACAAMYLRKLGHAVDQDYVFDQSGLSPLLGRGCHTGELVTALHKMGFRTGLGWFKFPADKKAENLQSRWKAVLADLQAGTPTIVCTRFDVGPESPETFRLVLGYDADRDEVIYHDPNTADGAHRRMQRATFLSLWTLRSTADERQVISIPLHTATLRVGRAATTFTAADYAQHILKLKKKIPSRAFTVLIQPPFVVIGDEPPAMVQRRATGTVKWSVDELKEAYFRRDPTDILDIWLFKDKDSYEKHCKQLFGHAPSTPYGFFSHTDKALVMNIRTGGGTLVHEIVHPFVAANFPDCPSWLNEGLGSLYEQSGEHDGKIVGFTNWRLAGLQDAIRAKRVPSFKTLCSTTSNQFYNRDRGTNYSQARYLCYYLQQQGLLRKFYHAFYAARRTDPSGYKTLLTILGRKDDEMDEFKKEWEAYVLKLEFP